MAGQIDCDVHPTIESTEVLLPYLDDYWREQVTMRGLANMDVATYRATLPLTTRPDWRNDKGRGAASVEAMARQILDPQGTGIAICNVVYGGSSLFHPYLAAAICSAVNDWLAREWLDRDDRLRGSIVVPIQDIDAAVREIDRVAADERFVQILFPVAGDMPFGRRYFWPIYEAAARHGLPIAIHPGGGGRFPPSYDGWHGLYSEDYFLQAHTLQAQIQSLVYEGVFSQYPELRVVILESGVSWLPPFMTDCDNKWMALRREVPWVKDSPSDVIRRHIRFSTQPFDVPDGGDEAMKIIEMAGSDDIFLFATDYPHWQYEGDTPCPSGLTDEVREKIMRTNPLATYPRLKGVAA